MEKVMQPEDCCQAIPIMPSPRIPWYLAPYYWARRILWDWRFHVKITIRWIKRRVFRIYIPVELWEIRVRRFRIIERRSIRRMERRCLQEDTNIFSVINEMSPSETPKTNSALTLGVLEEARSRL